MSRAESSGSGGSPDSSADGVAAGVTVALFSLSLGISGIAVPLLMIRAGYAVAEIGIVVAAAAVAQVLARMSLGALMRRLPDKVFVVASGVFMSVSCLLLTVSSFWAVLVVSQLLQGVARAFFWTGSQTHAVRMADSAVGAVWFVPGLMEALNPGKDERHGSTEEVPR
ncbi:MFS transporter [Nocardiopsis oceani]